LCKFNSGIELIAVTGASGFVGSALIKHLRRKGHRVRGVYRKYAEKAESEDRSVGEIGPSTSWVEALVGVKCIVHCAAKTHDTGPVSDAKVKQYHTVNVEGTRNLVKAAIAAGVKRFIFLSSIKTLGEETAEGQPFDFLSKTAPEDAYGRSKLQAERELRRWAIENQLELVIIRPPLIYGDGVKGNFETLKKLALLGIPLPLGRAFGKRSLIGLHNLLELITLCIGHEKAVGETFLVRDKEDYEVKELLLKLMSIYNKTTRLLGIREEIVLFFAAMLGKRKALVKLYRNLQVDSEHTFKTLGWQPSLSFEEEFLRENERTE
jgi:nucleoside-diphosphate-sugar epimerase